MAVAFDAVGPSSSGKTVAAGFTSPQTWSHTCTGSQLALFVAVAVGTKAPGTDADAVITGVTYAGVAMTFIGRRHSNDQTAGYIELWVLVNPATGANTVSVSITGTFANTTIEAGSTSFTGVDQSVPYNGFTSSVGNDTTPTISITSKAGDIALDVVAGGTGLTGFGVNQTNRWLANQNTLSGAGNAAQSTSVGATSVSATYTMSAGDWWAMLGVNVRAPSALPPLQYNRKMAFQQRAAS
jgi:hypothetical protein